ncbi:MAG: 3'-5' exoribonuclease [Alphaproteobacteria bacterium]|nr:3'-5' exoribonuclease [Alphaproteobacteria bacterium]MBU0860042.1 3'-5' exoribonuclease [Alphaproteobacteria bacterium]
MSKGKTPALGRYFFDTEFNEVIPERFGVDFISVGVVAEDGREYYGVHREFNKQAAADNSWVSNHVVPKLPPEDTWVDLDTIRQGIVDLIQPAHQVEFWAKNNSYDTFILCRLFGGMNGLRDALYKAKGIEKVIFRDSNDLRRNLNWPALPEQAEDTKHDALADARQEKVEFEVMTGKGRSFWRDWRPGF